jgi:hypothetical protein
MNFTDRELRELEIYYGYNRETKAEIIFKLIQDIKELKQKVPLKLGLIEIEEEEVRRQMKERFDKK